MGIRGQGEARSLELCDHGVLWGLPGYNVLWSCSLTDKALPHLTLTRPRLHVSPKDDPWDTSHLQPAYVVPVRRKQPPAPVRPVRLRGGRRGLGALAAAMLRVKMMMMMMMDTGFLEHSRSHWAHVTCFHKGATLSNPEQKSRVMAESWLYFEK